MKCLNWHKFQFTILHFWFLEIWHDNFMTINIWRNPLAVLQLSRFILISYYENENIDDCYVGKLHTSFDLILMKNLEYLGKHPKNMIHYYGWYLKAPLLRSHIMLCIFNRNASHKVGRIANFPKFFSQYLLEVFKTTFTLQN